MAKRIIKEKIKFEQTGTFKAYWAAEAWCRENGYSTGSACYPHREVAIMKGEYNLPQKWKNTSKVERNSVDGVIVSDSFREGPVEVIIYE